jgi:hypothetical protein
MKRALFVLAILAVIGTPAWAQGSSEERILKLEASGTAIPLGNPFAGDFSLLANWQGTGPLGKIGSQAIILYQQIDPVVGNLVCRGGQIGLRFESNGDVLLLTISPGFAGTSVPVSPTAMKSEQNLAGVVVGGTGRFAGATGSFTMSITGLFALPGLVHVAEGTIEIALDRK